MVQAALDDEIDTLRKEMQEVDPLLSQSDATPRQ